MVLARLILLSVTALTVLAFGASTAQAQTTVLDCVLAPGEVTGTAGLDSIFGDITDLGGPLDTDDGTFMFEGDAMCVGLDGPWVAELYSIDAAGTYSNLLCGTGYAEGNAVLTGWRQHYLEFTIDFTAMTGDLRFRSNDFGSGVIEITPNWQSAGGNCITTDVTSFFVDGSFSVVIN
jgi:hypothetical protein